MTSFSTLFTKELLRFWKVSVQTVVAPVLTSLLYLVIFGQVLEGRVQVFEGVRYTAFLVPGLVMMSVLQNAFANSSSSLIQSKITGNIVFILLAPISYAEFFWAYVAASVVRGLAVGAGVLAFTAWFVELRLEAPLWTAAFAFLGAALLGALGLLAGIVSEKIDQLAAFQNFVILPLTMLSGVFYSIHSLPGFWRALSHANPFFYMIDGFRYGFFGVFGRAARDQPGSRRHRLRRGSMPMPHAAQIRLQAQNLDMVTPESVKSGIEGGPRLRARRSGRRRPAFPGAGRLGAVRRQQPRAAPPARLQGAGRPHARRDPRAVHADAHARRMEESQRPP